MEINTVLKKLRQDKGMTQAEAAEYLGINLSSYQKYERQKNTVLPSIDVIVQIAERYGVSTDYLLGRSTEEKETLDELAGEFNMSLLEKKILEGYLELPRDLRGDFMDFLYKAVQEVKQESES